MHHGVGLGYELGYRHYLIKTFVTYDMARGRQKMIFESTRDDATRKLESAEAQKLPVNSKAFFELSEEELREAVRKYGNK